MPIAHSASTEISAASKALAPDQEQVLQGQQTRLLFANGTTGVAVTFTVTLAMVGYFWDDVGGTTLVPWMAALMLLCVARVMLQERFRHDEPVDARLGPWRRAYFVGTVASGMTLGIAWWIIAPAVAFDQQLLLAFVLGGMALGGVPVLSASLPVHYFYATAVCMPAAVWMLINGAPRYITLAVLTVCFYAAVLATGTFYHRSLKRMMRLAVVNNELRAQQTRLRDFAKMNADLFWESDDRGRFTYLSEGYEQLTGIPAHTMLGERVDSSRGPCFLPERAISSEPATQSLEPFSDHVLKWSNGGAPATVLMSNAIAICNEQGEFVGLRGTVRDITKEHVLSEVLSYQARHDALTDLANRREFDDRLTALLKLPFATSVGHAVCYVDLDQFKLINDTCGHAAGDALLRQLAGVLRRRLRAQDLLARLGGDEFGILIENCSVENSLTIAEGIRTTIEGMRFQWESSSFNLTASIGVVPVTDHNISASEIMMAVDAACYAAKDGGRNRVHLYQEQDEVLSRRHGEMQWVARITRALQSDGLALAAQPIIPIRSTDQRTSQQDLRHFEILLRMRGENEELIMPGSFLPAAERYGLAIRVDTWVFDTTLRWLLDVPGRLDEVETCCINLSGQAISDANFLNHVIDRLRQEPKVGSRLCFEITETAAISDLDKAVVFMEQLREFGCRFALDDFGTGLSSFGYLRTLPVDFLKIDGVFVRDMETDEVDFAMVRSISEVGRIMGKKTVAEYVENKELLAMLEDLDVDFAQGFAVGKPQALDF